MSKNLILPELQRGLRCTNATETALTVYQISRASSSRDLINKAILRIMSTVLQ